MSKRKPHNIRVRVERSCRALLNSNHVAVVNIDPSGRQGMINYKSLKNIAPGKIGQAVCGIPHRWTIYLSVLCIDARGDRYSKSVEIAPNGVYLSDHLEDVIEHCYKQLRDAANQNQMVASGWIAIPETLSLDEAHAARIFEAVGAWNQVKVDSCAAQPASSNANVKHGLHCRPVELKRYSMAKTSQERSAKAAKKRVANAEEELRLRVRPGTRQALADLMEWSGITEQGEAMTLMIHHLHALGWAKCQPLLNPPRHVFEPTEIVAREFLNKSLLAIQKDPGDEIIEPG